jgi:hypothetical protein
LTGSHVTGSHVIGIHLTGSGPDLKQPFNYMLKSKFSLSRYFEYANEQFTYHFWLCNLKYSAVWFNSIIFKIAAQREFGFLTGNFLLAWAGQFAGIKNKTMHRFEQYLKILQLYHENSRFPPSFKFEA